MSRKWRNILIGIVAAALAITGLVLLSRGPADFREKYEGADLSTDVTGIGRSNTYGAYLAEHEGDPAVTKEVAVELSAFEGEGGSPCDDGVMTSDKSELTWKVDVPQAGLYNIRLDYLTVESRGIDVERELAINGEVPFAGASTLSFSRLWTDSGDIRKDNQGNDIRPTQTERFEKQSAWCMDSLGYQTEPYAFYFNEGENTLTLKAVNEPVILCGITLTPPARISPRGDCAAASSRLIVGDTILQYICSARSA